MDIFVFMSDSSYRGLRQATIAYCTVPCPTEAVSNFSGEGGFGPGEPGAFLPVKVPANLGSLIFGRGFIFAILLPLGPTLMLGPSINRRSVKFCEEIDLEVIRWQWVGRN